MKLYIFVLVGIFNTQTALAQFGNLIQNIQQRVDDAQKQIAPLKDALPPSVVNSVTNDKVTNTKNIRQEWLNNPYPDIPREVTDQDIQDVTLQSANKVFKYLNSPNIDKAYKKCQTKEQSRIGLRAQELQKASNSAKTQSDKNELIQQSQQIEAIKSKISPSTCFLRVVRRATIDLNLEFYSTQPKYGGPLANDEQFNVVQLFKVGRALENGELTNVFHDSMSKEIEIDFNEWIEKYLMEIAKANVNELKKQVPANDRKTREQLDAGAEIGVVRRVNLYNQAVNTIADWINSGLVKP